MSHARLCLLALVGTVACGGAPGPVDNGSPTPMEMGDAAPTPAQDAGTSREAAAVVPTDDGGVPATPEAAAPENDGGATPDAVPSADGAPGQLGRCPPPSVAGPFFWTGTNGAIQFQISDPNTNRAFSIYYTTDGSRPPSPTSKVVACPCPDMEVFAGEVIQAYAIAVPGLCTDSEVITWVAPGPDAGTR